MDTARWMPSCERHRGCRTRDRPPARGARRNGCGGGRRFPVAATVLDLPVALPAALPVAVPAADRGPACRDRVDAEGSAADARRSDAGDRSGLAAVGCRVASAHLIPQAKSAWRKLSTLFSTVNNCACECTHANAESQHARHANARRRAHRGPASARGVRARDALKASIGAALRACDARMRRHRARAPACACRARRGGCDCAPRARARRIFRAAQARLRAICAKSARVAAASRCACARLCRFRRPEKRNPRRRRRGSALHAGDCAARRQSSSSSSSA